MMLQFRKFLSENNDKTIATLQKNEYNDYSYKTVLIAGVPCVELTAL